MKGARFQLGSGDRCRPNAIWLQSNLLGKREMEFLKGGKIPGTGLVGQPPVCSHLLSWSYSYFHTISSMTWARKPHATHWLCMASSHFIRDQSRKLPQLTLSALYLPWLRETWPQSQAKKTPSNRSSTFSHPSFLLFLISVSPKLQTVRLWEVMDERDWHFFQSQAKQCVFFNFRPTQCPPCLPPSLMLQFKSALDQIFRTTFNSLLVDF